LGFQPRPSGRRARRGHPAQRVAVPSVRRRLGLAMAVGIDELRSTACWQFRLGGDWQPFTLGASAAVEARHAMWVAGRGPALVRERSACGHLEYCVNFATMTQLSASTGIERPVRRDELYDRETVEELLRDLLRERRAREAAEAAAAGAAGAAVGQAGRRSRSSSCCPRASTGSYCAGAADAADVAASPQASGEERRAESESCDAEIQEGYAWADGVSAGDAPSAEAPVDDAPAGDSPVPRTELWHTLEPLEELSDRLFALPTHTLEEKPFELTPIAAVDPRRQLLEKYFLSNFEQHRRAMGEDVLCPRAEIEVKHVLEVYNPVAVQAYRNELALMRHRRRDGCTPVPGLDQALHVRTDLGGPQLNEVLLFHGTSWAASTGILHEGFDPRLHGLHAGAAFGGGSYFTPVASKADFYTRQMGESAAPANQNDPRTRVVLVGRVALGEVHQAAQYSQSLRRPPADASGRPLDSVMGLPSSSGGVLDFPELVVYKPSQVVPQFVICYRHKVGCGCRTCLLTAE